MKKHSQLSTQEQQLIERLRRHPELMARFQSILEISVNVDGRIQTADQVEAFLIEEMRRLGHTAMEGWAAGVEEHLSQQLRQQEVSTRARKKNPEVVVCVRAGEHPGADLAHAGQALCALVA